MLKRAAIVLAAIAITACGEDTVATTPAVETAPVAEVAAAPAVEVVETAKENVEFKVPRIFREAI